MFVGIQRLVYVKIAWLFGHQILCSERLIKKIAKVDLVNAILMKLADTIFSKHILSVSVFF